MLYEFDEVSGNRSCSLVFNLNDQKFWACPGGKQEKTDGVARLQVHILHTNIRVSLTTDEVILTYMYCIYEAVALECLITETRHSWSDVTRSNNQGVCCCKRQSTICMTPLIVYQGHRKPQQKCLQYITWLANKLVPFVLSLLRKKVHLHRTRWSARSRKLWFCNPVYESFFVICSW